MAVYYVLFDWKKIIVFFYIKRKLPLGIYVAYKRMWLKHSILFIKMIMYSIKWFIFSVSSGRTVYTLFVLISFIYSRLFSGSLAETKGRKKYCCFQSLTIHVDNRNETFLIGIWRNRKSYNHILLFL